MPSADASDELVDSIYEAALEPELWDRALIGVADTFDSLSGILMGVTATGGIAKLAFAHFGRLDPDFNLSRATLGLNQNPWLPALARQPLGRLIASDAILPLADARRTEFYREVVTPQDDEHVLMASLGRRNGSDCLFFLARSVRTGPYAAAEIKSLQRLMPHLCRAAEIYGRTTAYWALALDQQHVLELMTVGIVLVDASGNARCVNSAAERIIRLGRCLRLVRGRLSVCDPAAHVELLALIAKTSRGSSGETLALSRGDHWLPLIVRVCPLRAKRHDRTAARRDAVALFITDGYDPMHTAFAGALSRFYRLTAAEARVAASLADGLGVSGTADLLGLSTNTVKTHAKRVYAKMGLRGQVELMRVVARPGWFAAR